MRKTKAPRCAAKGPHGARCNKPARHKGEHHGEYFDTAKRHAKGVGGYAGESWS